MRSAGFSQVKNRKDRNHLNDLNFFCQRLCPALQDMEVGKMEKESR
jgi:hypothetical protein